MQNEELLASIEENSQKLEETSKILLDYKELLKGKEEILTESSCSVI